MNFDLTAIVKNVRKPRRRAILLRQIIPPGTMATNLYRAAYLRVVETWQGALPRIMAEYERSLAQMTTDSPADLDGILAQVEAELQRLYIELTPRLRDWLLQVERWQRGKWRGAALSATGVDLETLLNAGDVAETLDAFLARNVALVKDVGAEAQRRISDAVFRGLTGRFPARGVAKEIADAVGMSRKRALRIASDQLSKASAALDSERRLQAGLTLWKWRHSGKLHARPWHKARDGNLYTDDPAEVGDVLDGDTALAPPERDDRPGVPPYCGCRQQAVVRFD